MHQQAHSPFVQQIVGHDQLNSLSFSPFLVKEECVYRCAQGEEAGQIADHNVRVPDRPAHVSKWASVAFALIPQRTPTKADDACGTEAEREEHQTRTCARVKSQ